MATGDWSGAEVIHPVAAVFSDVEQARAALRELQVAGFEHRWLGITRAGDETTGGEPVAEPDRAGGVLAVIEHFISGEDQSRRPLHEALMRRGIAEPQARALDRAVTPGEAVVTVDAAQNPRAVLEIVGRHGGRVEAASVGLSGSVLAAETAIGTGEIAPSQTVAAELPSDEDVRSEAERERRRL